MTNTSKIFSSTALILAFICSHVTAATPQGSLQTPPKKSAKKPTPRKDDLQLNVDSGLSIIDSDKNGIRDDIDAVISAKVTDPEIASAATRYARAAQMSVSHKSPSMGDVRQTFVAIVHAIECLKERVGDDASFLISNIRAATTNTKDRHTAYVAMQDALARSIELMGEVPPVDCVDSR